MRTLLFFLLALSTLELAWAEGPRREASPAAGTPEAVAARLKPKPAGTPTKAVVLFFVARDCPISNALAPEMSRIVKKYEPLGVECFFVYADRDLTEAEAAKHAGEYGLNADFTVDRTGLLVKQADAKVTPEAAVFGPSGKVLYRGRINDLFPALGKKQTEPTTHDLRVALDAIMAGKSPPVATSPAIGCFIATPP